MKKIILILLSLLPVSGLLAQSNEDETALMISLFGKDRKGIVSDFVKVDGNKETVFWNIYEAFDVERKAGMQKKFSLLNRYVKNYSTLSEKETDEIVLEIILLTQTQEKLLAKYYKKIKKNCSVFTAAQFYQIEYYLLSEVRTSILESIPVISEMQNKK